MPTVLPSEFDANMYRNVHPDLKAAGFDDAALKAHYDRHGRDEGRACSEVRGRADFLSLIPADASILEICPGFTPALKRAGVKYYDTETSEALVAMAEQLNVRTATIPAVDYVSPADDMGVVMGKFDVLLSVHNLTRHANLIAHLQQCEKLLAPGGMMFCIVPDKRYTYDHFTPETSLATLLARYQNNDNGAHLEHTLAAVGTSAHYDARRHWAGRPGHPGNSIKLSR